MPLRPTGSWKASSGWKIRTKCRRASGWCRASIASAPAASPPASPGRSARDPNVLSFKMSRLVGLHDDGLRSRDPFDGTKLGQFRAGEGLRASACRFTGRGCIVAALDFGLDFAHPNFLNADGTTRLLALWDQGAAVRSGASQPFGYGRQYTPAEINAALGDRRSVSGAGLRPATKRHRQGHHGCPYEGHRRGQRTVRPARARVPPATPRCCSSTCRRVASALRRTWAIRCTCWRRWTGVDETARSSPWVVNLSVGSTAGSHDGTSLVEQGMHELLRSCDNGAICQSAGNYRSADLAVHGRLADGEHRDLGWIIDPADTTPNEL